MPGGVLESGASPTSLKGSATGNFFCRRFAAVCFKTSASATKKRSAEEFG